MSNTVNTIDVTSDKSVLSRAEVVARLKSLEPKLSALGVDALYLYGSFARNEARSDSDIDLFVEAEGHQFYDLTPYMAAFFELQDAFPLRTVGYTTRRALAPYVRKNAERDALKIF
jgi:uncharacterized protein